MTPDPLRTLWLAHSTRSDLVFRRLRGGVAADEAGHAGEIGRALFLRQPGAVFAQRIEADLGHVAHGARRRSAIAPAERVRAAAISSRPTWAMNTTAGSAARAGAPAIPTHMARSPAARQPAAILAKCAARRSLRQACVPTVVMTCWSLGSSSASEWTAPVPQSARSPRRVTRRKANAPTTKRPLEASRKKATPFLNTERVWPSKNLTTEEDS